MCLHTFTVVKTSPSSRKTLTALQRLKRNLTILTRTFNLTQAYPRRSTRKNNFFKDRSTLSANYGLLDRSLVRARPTNTRIVRLFSKNLFFLEVQSDGFVNGTLDSNGLSGKSFVLLNLIYFELLRKLAIV